MSCGWPRRLSNIQLAPSTSGQPWPKTARRPASRNAWTAASLCSGLFCTCDQSIIVVMPPSRAETAPSSVPV